MWVLKTRILREACVGWRERQEVWWGRGREGAVGWGVNVELTRGKGVWERARHMKNCWCLVSCFWGSERPAEVKECHRGLVVLVKRASVTEQAGLVTVASEGRSVGDIYKRRRSCFLEELESRTSMATLSWSWWRRMWVVCRQNSKNE